MNNGNECTTKLGREITSTIKYEEICGEIDNILVITKPIYQMIKFANGEG